VASSVSSPGDALTSDQELTTDQRLTSANGQYFLVLQGDGNLVLRQTSTGAALWSSKTNGSGAVRFRLQSDGNLVLRDAAGKAVWCRQTNGSGAVKFTLQDDGNLVLRDATGNPVWSSETAQSSPDTTKPVITLNGSANMYLLQGFSFSDPGATALDDRDGN